MSKTDKTEQARSFEEEREMTVMLLVDVSASGEFGTQKQLKQELFTIQIPILVKA